MPVTEIILLRHGHRVSWQVDPTTGTYTISHPCPTNLPADPSLAAHGVDQAKETGVYLAEQLKEVAEQDRLRVYSSLFYRCLETLRPTMENLRSTANPDLLVNGERGFGEWFGKAWFEQPIPATAKRLKDEFFPFVNDQYESLLIPDRNGEKILELHERTAKAFSLVIPDIDRDYEAQGRGSEHITLLICGHAGLIIAAGRVLTGQMPEDILVDDYKCFTCGISRYTRKESQAQSDSSDEANWRGRGVVGGWHCTMNSGCDHLKNGEERGFQFRGDEDFDLYGPAPGKDPITSNGGSKDKENPARL